MKNLIFVASLLTVMSYGCKSSDAPAPAPEKASLISPGIDEVCRIGNVISVKESRIIFEWFASTNTESYEVIVKDLLSGVVSKNSTIDTRIQLTLKRDTPYSWYVVSKSSTSSATTTSDVRRFYNSGPGISSYAPYPAEIISPLMNSTISAVNGKITLDWTGSDVDGDIVSYDLYFSPFFLPVLFKAGLTESKESNLNVVSKTTYYWKVITKDSKGNTSDSDVYQFKVN